MSTRRQSFPCPHCGEPVSVGAGFCRACGSDEQTGWSESAEGASEGGWSEERDDFDYDEYLREEFPEHVTAPSRRARLTRVILWLTVIGCIVAMIWSQCR